MLELISHQIFRDGLPEDLSPYRNYVIEFNTMGSPNGAEPNSGAIMFPHPNSRVVIKASPAWDSAWVFLGALKIEVLARVNPETRPMSYLVAGHNSFRFGLLEGALAADFQNSSGTNNFV